MTEEMGNIRDRLNQALVAMDSCSHENTLAVNNTINIGTQLMAINEQIVALGSQAIELVETTYPQFVLPPTERASEALQRVHDNVATVLEGAEHPKVQSGLGHLQEAVGASRDISRNVTFASTVSAQEIAAAMNGFLKAIRKAAKQDLITPFLGGDQLEGAAASFLGEAPNQNYVTHTSVIAPIKEAKHDLEGYLGEIL